MQMHDNIRASEAVKDSKSMVFLIPMERKLQNSPGSIYKYSFITL